MVVYLCVYASLNIGCSPLRPNEALQTDEGAELGC